MNNNRRHGSSSSKVPYKQVDRLIWEIPKDYKRGMRVPGRIYTDKTLLSKMTQDRTLSYIGLERFPINTIIRELRLCFFPRLTMFVSGTTCFRHGAVCYTGSIFLFVRTVNTELSRYLTSVVPSAIIPSKRLGFLCW